MQTMTREQDRPLACANARITSSWVGDASQKVVKIVPDGVVESKRGTFTIDAAVAKRIIDAFHAHGVELPIDFDHAVVTAEPGEAKAVGWITELEYVPGEGILARVDWRDVARAAIRSREYQYLSPVFALEHGEIVELDSAALTNKPAIPRMEKLAASTRGASGDNREVRAMTDATVADTGAIIGKIAGLLNIDAAGDPAAVLQAIFDKLDGLVTDGTLELASGKGAKTTSDRVVANATRSVLGLDAKATGEDTLLAFARVCAAGLVQRERMDQVKAIVDPYVRRGIVGSPDAKYNREDYPKMLALAAVAPEEFETVVRNRAALLPPQGRSTPPKDDGASTADRSRVIAKARDDFASDPRHGKVTTLRAFTQLALMDAGLPALHTNEMHLVEA